MKGPWIKSYAELEVHRKTCRMIADLDCVPGLVIGCLQIVWWMADREATPDGFLSGVTLEDIDAKVRVPGFAKAMEAVGWLEALESGVLFPEFAKHMGQKHRKRAKDRKHSKAYRERQKRQSPVSADAALTTADRQVSVSESSDKTETKTSVKSDAPNPTGSTHRGTRAARPDWRSDLEAAEFAGLRHHPGFEDAWQSWLDYRREAKLKLPAQRTYKATWRKAKDHGTAALVAAIEQSIAQGWQGLFPEKAAQAASKPAQSHGGKMNAADAAEVWRAQRAAQGASQGGPRDVEVEPESPFRLLGGA